MHRKFGLSCLAVLTFIACSKDAKNKTQTPCTAVYVNSVAVTVNGFPEEKLDQMAIVLFDGETPITFTRRDNVFVSDTDRSGAFRLQGHLSAAELFAEDVAIPVDASGCHAVSRTLTYTCSDENGTPSCIEGV